MNERVLDRRQLLRGSAASALVLLAPSMAWAWLWSTPTWPELKKKIRADFPSVSQWSVPQLQQALEQKQTVRLFDVRRADEFKVSHLRGAMHGNSAQEIIKHLQGKRDGTIVVYCSVGLRSAKIAHELNLLGYANAVNLEGSLFEWANEGLPVYRGEEKVTQVHPFDKRWGILLKSELRSSL